MSELTDFPPDGPQNYDEFWAAAKIYDAADDSEPKGELRRRIAEKLREMREK